MRYTPVELRHVRISRGFFGYRRDETNRMLEDVADSFEEVWSERGELVDKLEETEKQLAEFKEREVLLANTLISAEKAATDAKELARREAELILSEAHQEARSITRTAIGQREHLFAEARRVETLLRSALGIVEESGAEKAAAAEGEVADEAGSPEAEEHWPRREDTREFQLPLAQSAAELQAEAAEPVQEPEPEPQPEPEPEPAVSFAEPAAEENDDKPLPPPLPPAAEEAEVDGPWAGRDFAWG
jgi:cell division septum initiation protein DivIVA